jgi:hypothetical protein
MLFYERLPETNVEVAGLLHALGYSNDWQLLNKYKLKYSILDEFHNNDFVLENDNIRIKFLADKYAKSDNEIWNDYKDSDKADSFTLIEAEVELVLSIENKNIINRYTTTKIKIPIAIPATTQPEEILDVVFEKLEQISKSMKVELHYEYSM